MIGIIISSIIILSVSLFLSVRPLQKIEKLIFSILLSICGISYLLVEVIWKSKFNTFTNYLLAIFGAIFLFIGLFSLYHCFIKKERHLSVKEITMIGVQSAITFVLYFFVKFNLPFFPPWLDIQISEVPALITGFAYGPYAGAMVLLVRFALKLPASITVGVGEFGDLILGLLLVLTSSLFYRKKKTFLRAVIGLLIGVGVSTIAAIIINYFVLIPAYIYLADFPLDALVGMMSYIKAFTVTKENFMAAYLLIGVLPFNLLRYALVFGITILIYKRIHKLLKRLTNK